MEGTVNRRKEIRMKGERRFHQVELSHLGHVVGIMTRVTLKVPDSCLAAASTAQVSGTSRLDQAIGGVA